MRTSAVTAIQRRREYPSVSILITTEPGRSLATTDRVRLQRHIDDLARRLLGDVDAECAVDLMERLQALMIQVSDWPTRRSLALFASPSMSDAYHLDVDVRERTIVDDTFATRDLVDEARRLVTYLAATVSDRHLRVLEGSGDRLVAVTSRGFPLERWPGESSLSWERRTVSSLRRLGDGGVPLVLFGAERRIAALLQADGVDPVAVVRGNHDQTPWTTLGQLARPRLDEWAGSRNAAALHRLEEARGRRRLATGLDEIWSLAHESRVELLVVERGFEVPVRTDGHHLVQVAPEEVEAPDVVDDAVDDLIETVLLRRGEVVIVPDGMVEEWGRVAAVLRY